MADPYPSLHNQLAAIGGSTPDAIRQRLDDAIAELRESGSAHGLNVGAQAPDFSLPDALGRTVSLTDHLNRGPIVLTFYRGEWCPYCNLQLHALQEILPSITAEGATVIAVSPQSPDHSLSLSEKHNLEFPVLSDATQQVIAAYNIQFTVDGKLRDLVLNVFHRDPRSANADGSFNLPIPATFVIDTAGVIRARFVNPDWRERMEPAEILASLRSLRPAASAP